jgi:hypothetical protein
MTGLVPTPPITRLAHQLRSGMRTVYGIVKEIKMHCRIDFADGGTHLTLIDSEYEMATPTTTREYLQWLIDNDRRSGGTTRLSAELSEILKMSEGLP